MGLDYKIDMQPKLNEYIFRLFLATAVFQFRIEANLEVDDIGKITE